MLVPDKPWKVIVDDNFDHGHSSFTPVAAFDTLDEAIAECKSRVDAWLTDEHKPGMRGEELFQRYACYGDDPWILGGKQENPVPFRAWHYAMRRCEELCGRGG